MDINRNHGYFKAWTQTWVPVSAQAQISLWPCLAMKPHNSVHTSSFSPPQICHCPQDINHFVSFSFFPYHSIHLLTIAVPTMVAHGAGSTVFSSPSLRWTASGLRVALFVPLRVSCPWVGPCFFITKDCNSSQLLDKHLVVGEVYCCSPLVSLDSPLMD